MKGTSLISEVRDIYNHLGQRRYGLEEITQLDHALQTAALAERQGESPAFIIAALLHDIGQMISGLGENPAGHGIDNRHDIVGANWLNVRFGPEISEPVRLHVAAKRYLCAKDSSYAASLAPDSILSLSLQGGPMPNEEIPIFLASPYAHDAIRLRRFDDQAKSASAQTPPLEHFLECARDR